MIERLAKSQGRVVGYEINGKLTDEDYQVLIPQLEKIITEHGKLRLLMVIKNFKGWTLEAMWDDLKLGIRHHNDLERIAIVGEDDKQQWMATISKPFISAPVEYFHLGHAGEAWHWIREGL